MKTKKLADTLILGRVFILSGLLLSAAVKQVSAANLCSSCKTKATKTTPPFVSRTTAASPHAQWQDRVNRQHHRHTTGYGLAGIIRLLRLRLVRDPSDYDDIVIGFNAGATSAYNSNQDSRYMPGAGAEGLASFSSDGVALSINVLPLPVSGAETIRLGVSARNSGTFTIERTELDSLPPTCNLWLVDHYKNDSINLRTDTAYVLAVNKADTATYGGYRLSVVVSNNAPAFRLTGFNVIKQANEAELSWTTQDEANSTHFYIERSTDRGTTFKTIDSMVSFSSGKYSYTDRNPPIATTEYRLESMDMNAAATYSNTITLLFSSNLNTITRGISVFPNPTGDVLQVSITGGAANTADETTDPPDGEPVLAPAFRPHAVAAAYNIEITSMTGLVIKNVTSSSVSWEDNVAGLHPGAYIIRVVDSANKILIGKQTFIKM